MYGMKGAGDFKLCSVFITDLSLIVGVCGYESPSSSVVRALVL